MVLTVAVAYQASAMGVWNQGVPKPAGVECEDLNEFLFPDGEVPADLLPVYGADATTAWEESWSSAEWAGGPICIRTIADPSCVAQGGCAAPAVASGGGSTPTPSPSLPTAWVTIAGGTLYLAVGDSVPMGVAPPCDYGTMEIRATAPLGALLSGPVPQDVTVLNPSFIGAVPFNGSFTVDTRCV
jgi:hypothetical protein